MQNKIAILLPYKENYNLDKAGAASIWVKDYLKFSNLKKKTVVLRNPKSTRPWQHVLEAVWAYILFAAKLNNNKTLNGQAFNFGPNSKQNKSVISLIVEIKKNSTFIAKKAKMFEEEKNVANKAPVDEINIISLSKDVKIVKKNQYIINIGDYYFEESAIAVKDRLIKETDISSIKIKKLSKNKYRVFSGFFDSFNSMKDTYYKINSLGFELLDVIIVN